MVFKRHGIFSGIEGGSRLKGKTCMRLATPRHNLHVLHALNARELTLAFVSCSFGNVLNIRDPVLKGLANNARFPNSLDPKLCTFQVPSPLIPPKPFTQCPRPVGKVCYNEPQRPIHSPTQVLPDPHLPQTVYPKPYTV